LHRRRLNLLLSSRCMAQPIEPRPLSANEHALAEFLLSGDFPGLDVLKQQLGSARVVATCECGCGTVDFALPADTTRAICREPIPVEAYGTGVEVLLFVRDGLLSSLEIVDYGNERPLSYPKPADLTLWVPPGSPLP